MDKKIIGEGRTAKLYEYDDDKAIKLFYKEFEHMLDDELLNSKFAYDNDIPTPKTHGTVTIGENKGIVYDKLKGCNLGDAFSKNISKIANLARQSAQLHAKVNSVKAKNFRDQVDLFSWRIEHTPALNDQQKSKIIAYTKSLPNTHMLCHGDLHPENYFYEDGNLLVIDWMSAYSGHPAGDVARSMLTLESPSITKPLPIHQRILVKYVLKTYSKNFIETYMHLSNFDYALVDDYMLPTAAIRLSENIEYEKEWLFNIIDKYMDRI